MLRSLRIEYDGRLHVILDLYQRTRECCLIQRLRDHQRNRLSGIVDPIVLKRQIALSMRMQVAPRLGCRIHARHVAIGEHRDDTGRTFGGGRIDGDRPSVRNGAVHDGAVQCSRERYVRRVLRAARYLESSIPSR